MRWAHGHEVSTYGGEHDGYATVIIYTSVGNLAITCWNDHNGYYPHDVLAQWDGTEQYEGCDEIQTI